VSAGLTLDFSNAGARAGAQVARPGQVGRSTPPDEPARAAL